MSHFSEYLKDIIFIIILVYPILSWQSYRKLKELVIINKGFRINFYRQTLVLNLFQILILCYLLYPYNKTLGVIGLDLSIYYKLLGGLIIIGLISIIILPINIIKNYVQRSLEELAVILPVNKREGWYWAGVSLGAGITEELLFRGFLMVYLIETFPGISIYLLVIITSILFGLAHTYQGWKGVLVTSSIGIALATLFIVTGTIIPSMIVHTLLDLRILVIWPQKKD